MSFSRPESVNADKRILVVDDIIDNSFLLQIVLEEEGYQVEVANSGYAAIAIVQENPPDLILLDVMMPEVSGYEVTQQIRQNPALPDVPIILVTGYDHPSKEAALECGADGLIRKPIDFHEVIHQVRRSLDSKTQQLAASLSPVQIGASIALDTVC
jgi:CheY-like chemotaxis protein